MARKVIRRKTTSTAPVATPPPEPKAAPDFAVGNSYIRRWANENGFKLGDRGRIPKPVMDAFNARERSAPKQAVEVPEPPKTDGRSKAKPYVSGFCEFGNGHLRCPGLVRNGSAAPKPILYCACSCHQDAKDA